MYTPGRKVFHEEMIPLGVIVRARDGERLLSCSAHMIKNRNGGRTEWWSRLLWWVEAVEVGEGSAEGSREWGPASLEDTRTMPIGAVTLVSRE